VVTAANRPVVQREPASHRRHYRLTYPAEVQIGDEFYETKDWGLGGFSFENYQNPFQLGHRIEAKFALNFQGFTISFPVIVKITRAAPYDVAARFIDLGERETALIKYFVSSIVSGEVATVGDVLQRMDRPVTTVDGQPKPDSEEEKRKRRTRRFAVSAAYLTAGMLIGTYILVTLLGWLLRVNVETAVVSAPLETVVSKNVGHVTQVFVKPDDKVQAGQPLFIVSDEVVEQNLVLAQEHFDIAKGLYASASAKRRQEEQRMHAYQGISSDQMDSAESMVASLKAEYDVATLELERQRQLFAAGVGTQQRVDAQTSVVAARQAALQAAVAQQKITATSKDATKRGLFFTGNYVTGDYQSLVADEGAARDTVQAAEMALKQAHQRVDELTYRAAYPSVVNRQFKTAGLTVDRGENILVLRRIDADPYVDAYLTQDQVGYLEAGARGTAYVPARNEYYTVEVALIDRTSGFLKQMELPKMLQPQYSWRGVEDPSAYAKLTFVGLKPEEFAGLASGLPVYLNLPKRHHFFWSTPGDAPRSAGAGIKCDGAIRSEPVPAAHAEGPVSHADTPVLWPSAAAIIQGKDVSSKDFEPVRAEVLQAASHAVQLGPAPVKALHSSGVSDKQDPEFQATRRAFQDADRAALMAIAYRLTNAKEYLEGTRKFLAEWATTNAPTGQPIDETRIDGFLWAYDLVREKLSVEDQNLITVWFTRWRDANRSWKPGPTTANNNHMTHHLKIALMLDRVLGDSESYARDLEAAQQHLDANLGPADGASLDFHERDALHYQAFDLEAWEEIALLSGCCEKNVDRAFDFLVNKSSDTSHVEFAKSTAAIDRKRAAAGFEYAEKHRFQLKDAARAVFAYATLPGRDVPSKVWQAALDGKKQDNLFYLARYYLWAAT